MLKPKYKGNTIEIVLPEECGHDGYSVECTYKYNKFKKKYLLSMWLKRKDIQGKFRIESQEIDTQYISGTPKTIIDNICRIVEQASLCDYFEFYINQYEYMVSCFDRGNVLFEEEEIYKKHNE